MTTWHPIDGEVAVSVPKLNSQGFREIPEVQFSIPAGGIEFKIVIAAFERALIEAALRATNFRPIQAIALLGMNRSTFFDKVNRYGIEYPGMQPRKPVGEEGEGHASISN